MSEKFGDFLRRLAIAPYVRPADRKMLLRAADLIETNTKRILELQEENKMVWRRLSNKGKPDIEVPF